MIRMAKGLQHRLLAIALYITVIYGYIKSGRGLRPFLHRSFLLFWKPIFVHNAQFPVNLPPVPDRAGPAFRCFKCC